MLITQCSCEIAIYGSRELLEISQQSSWPTSWSSSVFPVNNPWTSNASPDQDKQMMSHFKKRVFTLWLGALISKRVASRAKSSVQTKSRRWPSRSQCLSRRHFAIDGQSCPQSMDFALRPRATVNKMLISCWLSTGISKTTKWRCEC